MRLVGPESLGVVNTDPGVSMVATYADVEVAPGPVGLLVQSGTLGVAALELAARRGVGISTFVDVGAKADVSGNDVLEYWESDPATRVALLYLESFGNPRKFVRIARRMAPHTPLVAVKAGDRRPGRRGTGLWPEAATYGALLAQCGVVRVDTLRQLFDAGRVLLTQPVPSGRRTAVVSNSRGATALTVDACVAAGLDVAPPVTLAFDAGPSDYAAAVDAALPGVDALVVVYAPASGDERLAVAEAVAGAVSGAAVSGDREGGASGCTTVATFLRPGGGEPVLEHAGVPIFGFPEEASAVLGRLAEHGAWLAQDPGEPLPPSPPEVVAGVRELVERVLAEQPGGRWLRWDEISALAECAGWPLAGGAVVGDGAGAVAAADRLGYPVALKVVDRRPLFRSVAGGVVLDLRSADEVDAAHRRLVAAADGRPVEVLVQRMAPEGVDVGLAVHQHPEVGAVASVGLGGVVAVADSDRPVALVPLTDADARRLVQTASAGEVLDAVDGTGAAVGHAAALVGQLATLADEVPELADVVADPVLVGPAGAVITDLRVRVAEAAPDAGPDVRRL
jgi:acyl-CoA synthetase (NDP forming)